MKTLQRLELLKDLVQQAVDRGATSVEAVHQHIAALPFEMLEKSGLLDDDKLKLKEKQQRTIGAVYDAIRRVNQQIGQLLSDQFELVEDGAHIKQVLDEQTQPAPKPAPKRKPAAKKRAPASKARKSGAKTKKPAAS
ncbi:hypothetical protein [Solimonas flava]|uniref:hypothetical protein n=1 Tax=Solimonas flava TaxID=415849 RepID=UPI0004244375|nr:hypothetical protein [Solimonas flava]